MADPPKALLIDLDGVVRRWDPALLTRAEHRHGLPAGSLAHAMLGHHESLADAVTGEITDEQWRADIARRLTAEHGLDAVLAVEEWSASVGEVDQDVLAIVREFRRTGPVGLVTNATTRLRSDLTRLGLDAEFDLVVNSSEVGFAKPDPEIFRHASASLEVAPQHCLFVDDTPGHVHAAEQAGLRGHVFVGADELRAALSLP